MRAFLAEIHRRALWQVVVIYLLGAAVVLWVVRALSVSVGLPPWTTGMAVFLLVISLPFTVASALVRDTGEGGNPLVELVGELHRRSLWQVVGIFLAGSWGAIQVVEVLTTTAGLPDWTPTMALVLLLIGLPVCLATAFVQEGMPGGGDDEAGSEATSVPGGAVDLLTWRNAFIGGVAALAILGLSAGGYLVMWSAGIGPVGSLMAQGAITKGQKVVLAEFDDATGQGLGAAVTEALRVDLLDASVLSLVDADEISSTLAQMQAETALHLDAERAREVALRAGIPVVIDGEVASAGSGYIITATLREAEAVAAWRVFA